MGQFPEQCAPAAGSTVATPSRSVTRQCSGSTPAPLSTMSGVGLSSSLPITVSPSCRIIDLIQGDQPPPNTSLPH
ncbi:unnamed protein product, partial [Iphiclides podalirius]